MKVIGVINDSGYNGNYIVEVSGGELSEIAGSNVGYLRVGAVIRVSDTVRRTKSILTVQSSLDQYANSLRAVADLLTTIQVVIPPNDEVKP